MSKSTDNLHTGESEQRSSNINEEISNSSTLNDNYLSHSASSNDPSPSPSHQTAYPGSFFSDDYYDAGIPPLERLTVFDLLDNLEIPQRLERLQTSLNAQKDKVRQQRQFLSTASADAKERVVGGFRRNVPSPEEQFDRYRRRVREGIDKLGRRWNNQQAVTNREKLAFCAAVLNIFISGYLIGGHAQWFPAWYTAQLLYFMSIRFYTYHRRGYHYFLADLCYFVNALLLLSIWAYPNSRRLFLSVYCLAFGNNAIAIAMWRNMLVFHSLDKVTSLFIHIMPCATLHCLVHLLEPDYQQSRFPAIYSILTATRSSPNYYSLTGMMLWASVPYMVWQVFYHAFITVRRREKIAAGRPTSFTYLRKSYSSTWIGKAVLSLPSSLQETAFMFIQYSYAILTMLPCPLWLHSRQASAAFLTILFAWSVYRGATYYIEVFGQRFRNELETLRKEVTRWQPSHEDMHLSPSPQPSATNSSSNSPKRGADMLADQTHIVENGTAAPKSENIINEEEKCADTAVTDGIASEAKVNAQASSRDTTATAFNENDASLRERKSEVPSI